MGHIITFTSATDGSEATESYRETDSVHGYMTMLAVGQVDMNTVRVTREGQDVTAEFTASYLR